MAVLHHRRKQRARPVPQNLHADADEKERRKPQDHAHASGADDARNPLRGAVAEEHGRRDDQRRQQPGDDRPTLSRRDD